MTGAILSIGMLVFLAHLFAFLFEKTKLPDVLPLMLIGIIAGPILGLVTPETFGKLGSVFAVVALILILFHSGLELGIDTLLDSMALGTRFSVIGFVLSVAAVSTVALTAMDFTPLESLLLGAILGGTSSAVVIPMVGRLGISAGTRTALVLESTFSDVLCIVFGLGFLAAITTKSINPGQMAGQILAGFLLAVLIGFGAAVAWSMALGKVRGLENSTFTTPAFVFLVYGVAETLGYSGAIAVFTCGVSLGNIHRISLPLPGSIAIKEPVRLNQTERLFLGEIVFLIKTFFFVYIGTSIHLGLGWHLLTGLGLTAAIFGARILVVRYSFSPGAPSADTASAFAMGPKGLAAAVLAAYCADAGIASAAIIQEAVYDVIFYSIVLSAGLVFLNERGYLNRFSRAAFRAAEPVPPPKPV